eukprot:UN29823
MPVELPSADILIHAGDFSNTGGTKDVREFVQWLESYLEKKHFKHIIVIAGNHDVTFEPDFYVRPEGGARFHGKLIKHKEIKS